MTRESEKTKAYKQRYYREHAEEAKAYTRRYRQEHAEEISARRRRYRQEHAEEIKTYRRHYQKDHTKKIKARKRIRRYGLDQIGFEALMERQEGTCALCRKPFNTTPCVDHCHDTGRVRGLLCHRCNRALGGFDNDPAILARAAVYVKGSGQR